MQDAFIIPFFMKGLDFMPDNTSKVQHITSLDFDVTLAITQLEELHKRVDTITQKMANTNWKIDAVINGSGEYAELNSQLQAANQQIKELQDELVNMSQVGINHTSLLASAIESKLVNALKNASVAAYEATKDTEDSMVEISRVLNLTASETEKLRNSLFSLGKEYGRSFADTADIALPLYSPVVLMYFEAYTFFSTRGLPSTVNCASTAFSVSAGSFVGFMVNLVSPAEFFPNRSHKNES